MAAPKSARLMMPSPSTSNFSKLTRAALTSSSESVPSEHEKVPSLRNRAPLAAAENVRGVILSSWRGFGLSPRGVKTPLHKACSAIGQGRVRVGAPLTRDCS